MRPWEARLRKIARTRIDVGLLVGKLARPDAADEDALLAPGVRVYRDGAVLVDRSLSPLHFASQFIEAADTYHQRNFDRLDFVHLLERGFALARVERERPLAVLDVGSGSGSSVFAACRLLPQARIAATDISPRLLSLLGRFVDSRPELRDRVSVYCFDLHRRFFRDDAFDLVVGAAILHHLLDPATALRNVAASLKRGGTMVFVEPLEAGSLVLLMLFSRALEELGRLGEGDGTLARLLRRFRDDIRCRLDPPVVKPRTALLDDKWVFDVPYLQGVGATLGLSSVAIHPAQDDLAHVFVAAFRGMLADSGHASLPIPAPVLDAVREFDLGVAPELKRRLAPTAIIVMTK